MKILTIAVSVALLGLCGCQVTTTPTAPASGSGTTAVTQAQLTVATNDTAAILAPILAKNPGYKADVKALGLALPGLLANGPINIQAYTAALATVLPHASQQEIVDLTALGAGLELILTGYEVWSGKTVAVTTDPNVGALVGAFAAGLVQAGS